MVEVNEVYVRKHPTPLEKLLRVYYYVVDVDNESHVVNIEPYALAYYDSNELDEIEAHIKRQIEKTLGKVAGYSVAVSIFENDDEITIDVSTFEKEFQYVGRVKDCQTGTTACIKELIDKQNHHFTS